MSEFPELDRLETVPDDVINKSIEGNILWIPRAMDEIHRDMLYRDIGMLVVEQLRRLEESE